MWGGTERVDERLVRDDGMETADTHVGGGTCVEAGDAGTETGDA